MQEHQRRLAGVRDLAREVLVVPVDSPQHDDDQRDDQHDDPRAVRELGHDLHDRHDRRRDARRLR